MSTNPDRESTAAERLRELQRLRDEDLITDDEFGEHRKLVLDESFGSQQSAQTAEQPDSASAASAVSGKETRASQRREQSVSARSNVRARRPARAVSPTQSDQSTTDSGALHPENWPDWLRVTLLFASGLWIVTIPFMFRAGARRTWLPYAGAALIAFAAFSLLGGDSGNDDQSTDRVAQTAATSTPGRPTQATPTRTPQPTPTPVPSSPTLGDRVRVGSLDLTVLAVEAYDSSQHNRFNEQNIRVLIEAVNARGDAEAEYNLSAFALKLVDANGIAHSPGLGCAGCPDSIVSVDLVRGGRVRGYIYFAVRSSRPPVELIYEPLFSFNKIRVRLPEVDPIASTPPPSTAQAASTSQSRIGDTVRAGDLDLTIISLAQYDSTRHNQFNSANVRVEIEAVNARGSATADYHLSSWAFELVDSNGIVRDRGIGGCASCPDEIGSVDLVQGGRIRGYIYFTIPAERELVELIYAPASLGDKVRISLR